MMAPRHGNSLSTFISWVALGSGHTTTLLPRSSSPDCPWFTYFVLEMEQSLEERSGLWHALLKELATSSGKANIDQSLKVSLPTASLCVS
ncbi:hypothetical protein PR048_016607 [Dryococelus australis]|uniref:Secreted protein n=1 Tax=Dryococelus australis TaxID=614101 RepID=A0ABQ9H746_9NEOP|nr:hypothetical protein PR048_016607 [Dryococelus australis]